MTTVAGLRVPAVSQMLVRQRAAALVARGDARVEVLRALPQWPGEESFEVPGGRVHVCEGISQLAILDAYDRLADGEFLMVLTDRSEQDLGDTVLLRASRRAITTVDAWSEVPTLFGALNCDRALRDVGNWAPDALLDHTPPGGWPPVASQTVTADHALNNLLARVLGLPLPTDLDALALLQSLDRLEVRSAWQGTDTSLRASLTAWAGDGIGPVARLALAAAAASTVSVVAVGLALDVLWPEGTRPGLPLDTAQIAARARIEPRVGGTPIADLDAREYASLARTIAVRMDADHDAGVGGVIAQAEALLADLGWAVGAEQSTVLRAGLVARLRRLGAAITLTLSDAAPTSAAVEGSLVEVRDHRLARPDDLEVATARMAVRLARWLCTPTSPTPRSLGAAMLEQVADGGWVDRALAFVWTGSADPSIGASYGLLAKRVQDRRRAQDEVGARLLADAARTDEPLRAVVPVEDLRDRIVAPLAAAAPVLLVVIDGMSVAVATELAEAAASLGWTELLPPQTGGQRTGALATLPTVTTYSRTSLFAGELLGGQQDTEQSRYTAALGSRVFHKDDLRSAGGALLPATLIEALGSERERAVAVVLNTVDDALSKADPGGTRWTEDTVQHLGSLLNAAAVHGRTVILTSDHGHVIERGGQARPIQGADARWRPVGSGPVGPGEVLMTGRRVLTPTGSAVLAWDEGLRYSSKQAGYHGGASLAEITIPVIVLARGADTSLAGWTPGRPQAPTWWNDAVIVSAEPVAGGRRDRRNAKAAGRVGSGAPLGEGTTPRTEPDVGQGTLGFEVPKTTEEPRQPQAVVEALLTSAIYAEQRSRAGRRALPSSTLTAVLEALVDRGGRAHRDTVAAAAGVATSAFEPTMAALKRLLNIEGYAVVSLDPDGTTVVLDVALLREQFALRP
jgi:PglZ domain